MKLKQKLAGLMAALMVLGLGSTAIMAEPSPGAGDFDSGYKSPEVGDFDPGYESPGADDGEIDYVEEKIADGIWFMASGTDSMTPWIEIDNSIVKDFNASLEKGFAYSCDKMKTQKTAVALNLFDAYNGKVTVPQKYMAKIAGGEGWVNIFGKSSTTGVYDDFFFSSQNVANGSKALNVDVSISQNSKVAAKLKDVKYAELTVNGAGNLPGTTSIELVNSKNPAWGNHNNYVYYYNASKDSFELISCSYSWCKDGMSGTYAKDSIIEVSGINKTGTYVLTEKKLSDKITEAAVSKVEIPENPTTANVSEKISETIKNSTSEKVVSVEIPKNIKVSTTCFKDAKEAGKTLVIEPADKAVTWTFANFDTLAEMSGDFDPSVKIGDGIIAAIDTAVAKDTSKTLKYTTVSFAYDGKLPGKTDVTLDLSVGTFKDGAKVYLYYFDEKTKKFEFVDDAVYTEGFATFTMTHCSDYIVTNEPLSAAVVKPGTTPAPTKKPGTTPAPTKKPATVKTGDTATMMVFGLVLLAGFGLMTVAYTRKRRA